jgi:hypothetical protein
LLWRIANIGAIFASIIKEQQMEIGSCRFHGEMAMMDWLYRCVRMLSIAGHKSLPYTVSRFAVPQYPRHFPISTRSIDRDI